MASVNKVILVGNLVADPEQRFMTNGDAVTNIRLATSESWKDKNTGEKKEISEFHRVVFYRKLAEIVAQFARKGGQIYLEGRIRTRKWTDKEGQERYTTEIEATEMQLLGGKREGAGERSQSGGDNNDVPADYQPNKKPAASTPPKTGGGGGSGKPSFDDLDPDIPF